MRALALIFALGPSALWAQSLPEQLAAAPNITYDEWRDLTKSKTVVYEIDGETFGYETYREEGNITFQLEDGSCIDGTWFMQKTTFCFDWEGEPLNCFNHKRLNGVIYVVGLENGEETAFFQKVSRIANIPITCGPALLSALVQP